MAAESMTITDDRPADAGPPGGGIEAGAEAGQPPDVDPAAETPLVEVGEIADAIRALGETCHGLAGHPEVPDHWGFTEAEIAQLAPPVAALVNRHARARAIARRSPELAVALTLSRWGIRNARLSAAIKQAEADLAAEDEAETAADDSGRHRAETEAGNP